MIVEALILPREAVIKEATTSQEQEHIDLAEDYKNENEEILQGNAENTELDHDE